MWIVRLALRRPYTFVVMALAIILLFPVVLLRTPVDIFPDINIPVISLVWTYNGLQPQEMEQRITSNVERGVTIDPLLEHVENQRTVSQRDQTGRKRHRRARGRTEGGRVNQRVQRPRVPAHSQHRQRMCRASKQRLIRRVRRR